LSNVQEKGSHLSQQKGDRTNHAGDTGIYIYEIFNPKGDLLCPELGTPQFLIINHEI